LVPAHEGAEPFPQVARLGCDLVEFPRHRTLANLVQGGLQQQLGLIQPRQKPLAVIDPIHWHVSRGCDRVQKIEAAGIGNKDGGQWLGHWADSSLSKK